MHPESGKAVKLFQSAVEVLGRGYGLLVDAVSGIFQFGKVGRVVTVSRIRLGRFPCPKVEVHPFLEANVGYIEKESDFFIKLIDGRHCPYFGNTGELACKCDVGQKHQNDAQ